MCMYFTAFPVSPASHEVQAHTLNGQLNFKTDRICQKGIKITDDEKIGNG